MKRIVLKLKRGVPLIDLGTDLVEAKFLRRPSRRNRSPYVADVSIVDPATSNSGREAIAHAPAMDLGGKCFEGVPMILRLARDRKGNLVGPNAVSKKYGTPRCELITQLVRCEEAENAKLGGTWIGAHPSIGEKVVHFMLQNDMIKEVPDIVKVEREVRNICGANMRTDFVVTSRSGRRTVVEVKTVVDTDYDSSLRDSVDEKCDNARGSHAKKKGSNKSKCVFYGSTKPYQRCAIFPWGRARQKGPEGEVVECQGKERMIRSVWLTFIALLGVRRVRGIFYLPGIAPREWEGGETVDVQVNKIDSVITQLPYDYYHLNFCKPNKVVEEDGNLGQTLDGEDIENSVLSFKMRKNEGCTMMCEPRKNTEEQKKRFIEAIEEEYRVHWIVDNLPVAVRGTLQGDLIYTRGYPVGEAQYNDEGKLVDAFIFNHLSFKMLYHDDPSYSGSRIVGFEVEPYSVKHKFTDKTKTQLSTCVMGRVDPKTEPLSVLHESEITYTYDVEWEESDIIWSSRWDIYLNQGPNKSIHWFSLVNSTLVLLFLSGIIAAIMLKILYKEIATYNEQYEKKFADESGEIVEETGWKLVHADVFRAPKHGSMLLSAIVGTGIQLVCMLFVLLFFAVLGFLSPANRGGLTTALLLFFVFMGAVSGYVSARLYKMLGGKKWRRNTLFTAAFLPFCVSGINFFINLFVWHAHSTKSIPFQTMIAIALLWVGISLPLNVMGAFFGYRKPKLEPPVSTNSIPRYIPPRPWYTTPFILNSISGLLPFGAVFIEIYFIMSAIWLHQIYYLFGFAFLVLIVLSITCAEISIVLTYLHLANENYRWWWQALWSSGSSSLYLFLYSIFYYNNSLQIEKSVSTLMYFGTMWQISFCFFLVTASIGFLASLFFVRKIYGSIKVD
eukprot:g1963.t1